MRKIKERGRSPARGLNSRMRPKRAVVVLLLLFGLLLASFSQVTASPPPIYTAKVARTVWITYYYTQVRDTVLINNTSAGVVGYVDFKIPTVEYAHLFSMTASDSSSRTLHLALQGEPFENFTFYRVLLDKPVQPGQTDTVTINRFLLFYGTGFSQIASNASLSVSLTPTILLSNPIYKANFTAYLPATTSSFDFTPSSYTLGNTTFKLTRNTTARSITGNLTNPQPDSLRPIDIAFSGDPGPTKGTDNIFVTSAQTVINLGDTVTAATTFVVYNARGGSGIGKTTGIMFMMPSAVDKDSVTASDFTGDLAGVQTAPTGSFALNITVPFRYDILQSQTYTFTLNYQLKAGSILQKSGDRYAVNLTSISPYIPFIINQQVRLVTPYGSSALQTNPAPSARGNTGGSDFAEFDTVNATALTSQNLQANFSYAWYWGFIKPWFYTVFIYLIGLAFAGVYLRQKPLRAAVAPAIVGDVKRFCDLYDEKTAFGVEVQRLEDALRRGKIAKPLYDKRIAEIESSRGTTDRQLAELSRSIRLSTPRYSKNLDQVELLEAELRTVNATVKDLQRQYAARKVSRRVYDDLTYTYEGRSRKIQSRIDSLIIQLREGH